MIDPVLTLLLAVVALVAPGYAWQRLLLGSSAVSLGERLLTSTGISLVIVPLSVFWASLVLGMPVTQTSVAMVLAVLIIIPTTVHLVRRRLHEDGD